MPDDAQIHTADDEATTTVALVSVEPEPESGLVPADLIDKARDYVRASKASSTRRTYQACWACFTAWCQERRLGPLPASPETMVGYIAAQADRIRPQTIKKHLAAISQAHKVAGFDTPVQAEVVKLTMQGLRRTHSTASNPKKALRVDHVRRMVEAMPDNEVGVRDKAILLLGFLAGMRRSEIAGLDLDDLTYEPEGLIVRIKKSKRDQDGEGRFVAVPRGRRPETCPVRAVHAWMELASEDAGPLFTRLDRAGDGQRITGKAIARVVKRRAERAGLDPAMFSGHSLRRGFATETARAGAAERDIARTTGHRSLQVLRSYVEEGTRFERCAAGVLDL